MKSFKSYRKGPFDQQTFYSENEVESICVDALHSVDLLPSEPEPIRIDRFIEKKYGLTIEYQDTMDDVFGYSIFGSDGVQGVVISTIFDKDGGQPAERKLRTTLAHEAGHCLLHTHLFCIKDHQTKPLFADYTEPKAPKILCRERKDSEKRYSGDWWEYQADMTIGSLLLPRILVTKALRDMLEAAGKLGVRTLPAQKYEEAAQKCSNMFNVNPVVARIRVAQLWPEKQTGQLTL